MSKLIVKKFTSSGSWTAPSGVTRVCVRLWGGGAGGDNPGIYIPGSGDAGFGGACAAEIVRYVDVVPNTSYTITIGSGGSGGTTIISGVSGGDTTFGSLVTGVGGSGLIQFIVSYGNGFLFSNSDWPYGSGTPGSNAASSFGGGPGNNGPGGAGGNGGNASDAGAATAGTSAAANSGGGGGGGGGTISGTEGNGGDGGSGYCEVIWVE